MWASTLLVLRNKQNIKILPKDISMHKAHLKYTVRYISRMLQVYFLSEQK